MTKTGLVFSLILLSWVSVSMALEPLKDPTRPLINTHSVPNQSDSKVTTTQVKKNQLKGIIFNDNHRKAIIDGRLVAEGERINGFIVHRINAHKVVLRSGSTYKTLTLSPSVKTVNQ
jgi:hypothetical protein